MAAGRTFEIGLVMAGAISAGAYSAGVIDFLMEALDAYEAAKAGPDWDGPTHEVRLPVIAGASAGGMTAALAALSCYHDIEHVWPDRAPPPPDRNRLYASWVREISLDRLLETGDLQERRAKAGVQSALCCDVLEDIVENAFHVTGALRPRPWVGGRDRPGIKILFTVSNLRGMSYAFKLFGATPDEAYGMLDHADSVAFVVGAGAHPEGAEFWLDVSDLSAAGWGPFKAAALATGAFPIGLRPRTLTRPFRDYESNHVGYTGADGVFRPIPPHLPADLPPAYSFVAVDGGMIDNEPFELARRELAGGPGRRNPRDGVAADRALILVDPFPNRARLPEEHLDPRLVSVVPSLIPMLIDQARFKPEELALAADDSVFSRFVISPIRRNPSRRSLPEYPIACGVLGGFGGFLHESFRRHDYLLGRRNAQAFLRWNFVLPETNALFDGLSDQSRQKWYVRSPPQQARSIPQGADQAAPVKMAPLVSGNQRDRAPALPIIPLVPHLRRPVEITASDLPRPDAVDLDVLGGRVHARATAVLTTLVDRDLAGLTGRGLRGWLVRRAAIPYARRLIINTARRSIAAALEDIRRNFPV